MKTVLYCKTDQIRLMRNNYVPFKGMNKDRHQPTTYLYVELYAAKVVQSALGETMRNTFHNVLLPDFTYM